MPLDPNALPEDAATLKKIVVDLAGQLDRESAEKHKYAGLIRELLEARRARSSERLTKEQAALFEEAWRSREAEENAEGEAQPDTEAPNASETATAPEKKRAARQPLARHVTRERIVHDLAEAEKHCGCCGKDLRLIAEESSER